MAVVEAILAVLGLAFIMLVARAAFSAETPTGKAEPEDLAAPYREGLHTAVRMQKVAADLEQQIYAEAARHLDSSGVEGS